MFRSNGVFSAFSPQRRQGRSVPALVALRLSRKEGQAGSSANEMCRTNQYCCEQNSLHSTERHSLSFLSEQSCQKNFNIFWWVGNNNLQYNKPSPVFVTTGAEETIAGMAAAKWVTVVTDLQIIIITIKKMYMQYKLLCVKNSLQWPPIYILIICTESCRNSSVKHD